MAATSRIENHRRRHGLTRLALAMFILLSPLPAQAGGSIPVVPGEGVVDKRESPPRATDWKRLWNTPIEVPLLDLRTFAGGLTPLEEGGDHLSKTLLFQGADGKRYLFVSLGKDPARGLSSELRGTGVERFLRDEAISINPVAELMTGPLLNAAGLPSVRQRLVLLPGKPALPARFSDSLAGSAGTIEELPEGADRSARPFMGARRIAGTDELLRELDRDCGNSVDAKAYLKARLVDLLVGDGDRMADQWRWAACGEGETRRWIPVPIRHYLAFSRKSGLVALTPNLQDFGPEYRDLKRLVASGRELDRRILPSIDRKEWMEATRELRQALTDSVITEAVRRMPPEMYRLEGKRLERELMSRRDGLVKASPEFYRLSAKVVDIHASAAAERVSAHRLPGGGIDIAIFRKGNADAMPDSPPLFRRTFVPGETREIRIYTGGGGDEILVEGAVDGNAIVARFIGDDSGLRFEDRTTSGSNERERSRKPIDHLYDAGPGSIVSAGPRTSAATRRTSPDPDRPDSGTEISSGLSTAQLNVSSDYGAMTGWGVEIEEYGFDDSPFRSRGELNGALAYGREFRYRFAAMGDIGSLFRNASLHLEASTSTLDNISHYGLGNGTRPIAPGLDEDRFETSSNITSLSASLRYPPRFRRAYFWEAGIETKWITTRAEADSFFELYPARIVGRDVEFTNDLQFGFHYDSRDSGREIALTPGRGTGRRPDRRAMASSAALSGMTFDIVGRYYPESMGNRAAFGKLNGEFRTFVPLNETRWSRLALRLGAQKNWGGYPYFEAAAVGGSSTIRGYDRNRFSGDASVYANTELRLYAGRGSLIVPIIYGPLLFVDTGRIFLAGEESDQWHTGIGGGAWMAFFESRYSAQLTVARGLDPGRLTDGYGIYLLAGFNF